MVAVDLFGPMPSSKYVVVVQDLSSCFPAAKIVTLTSAAKVLPALGNIYDAYGNPGTQISDNRPPFNSQAIKEFMKSRGLAIQHVPALHPSANHAETFMKPLGKMMRIAHVNKTSEYEALKQLLENYWDTPYPETGLSPPSMLFRDGQQGTFPRVCASDDVTKQAKTEINKESWIENKMEMQANLERIL